MNLTICNVNYVESNSTQVPKCHLNTKSKEYYLWTKVYSQRRKSKFKSWKNLYVLQIKLASLSMFSDDIDNFLMFFEFGIEVANN